MSGGVKINGRIVRQGATGQFQLGPRPIVVAQGHAEIKSPVEVNFPGSPAGFAPPFQRGFRHGQPGRGVIVTESIRANDAPASAQ